MYGFNVKKQYRFISVQSVYNIYVETKQIYTNPKILIVNQFD